MQELFQRQQQEPSLELLHAGTTIAAMVDGSSGLTETSNAYTITISSRCGSDRGKLNFSIWQDISCSGCDAVTQITGTVAEANIVYAGASEITGLGNEAVVTTETGLNDGSAEGTVAALNALDNNTTGIINAGSITSMTGSLADLLTAYGSNGITGLANETLTVSDTSTLEASDLNSLDSKTSGTVTTSDSLATLTGSVAALNTAYGSGGLTIDGDEDITITGSSVTVNAEDLNILNNYTSGTIAAANIAKLTGSIADINTAFASKSASGNGINFGGNAGAATQAVEITDTNILVSDLNTLDGSTSGSVDASTVAVMEGTITALNTAYASTEITGLANEAVTITDTTAAVADLVTLDGYTSGVIDASAAHTLSGTVANANLVYASSGFTGLGAEAVTLSDTSLADVAALNTLNGYTTGNINANTVTTLTGSISDLNTAYAAVSALGNGISNLGNEAVTVSDTGTITDLTALTTLNGYTSRNS